MRTILSFFLFFLSLPIFAQVVKKDTTLIRSENIYFDFGKDNIRPSEKNKLISLAASLREKFDGYIQLTAHTDSIGTLNNNYSLSERRGSAVIHYLMQQRIAPFSFVTRYDGEMIPIADNSTEEGRQKNRRVEIAVYKINTYEITHPSPTEPTEEDIVEIPEKEIQPSKENTLDITFIIQDEETNEPIPNAYITESVLDKKMNTTQGTWKGEMKLQTEHTYTFGFYAKGYFHNTENLIIDDYSPKTLTIKLKPIKKGNKLALRQLYFYGNQARLLPKSLPELRRLKESVLLNPDVLLEVGGHINYPNTHPNDVPQWSRDLSVRRAEVIYKYLIDSGVNPKQLSFKGYSNTQMINPTARTEEKMKPNRRVELKVMGYLDK